MSILKKLFGKKPTNEPVPAAHPPPAAPDPVAAPASATEQNPADNPNLIRAYDAYGREIYVTREQWRDNVLLGAIEQNWNDAEQLAGLIIQSLNDNFFEEMIRPAERLVELDANSERAVVLQAIVYMKVGRLDDSEKVLLAYCAQHGETGIVLTNLAKVHAERDDESKTLETLWRALQLDPNQDNGLGWYQAIHQDHGGDVAGVTAMRKVAALPHSWRAQLWLARGELGSHNYAGAIALYRESLARAGKPVPADLLMQMSGDLGNAGQIQEILQLAGPHFDVQAHGLRVGNNLIKALMHLGQLDDAQRLLNQLYAQNRPDWKENLAYWDGELAQARIGDGTVAQPDALRFSMLLGRGPVWLAPASPAAVLYPAIPPGRPLVTFLGGSADVGSTADHAQRQLADPAGRLSRALPLYLNEQMALRCGLRTQTLVPWLAEPDPGFVLSSSAWPDADAIHHAQQCEQPSAYVVVSHLVTKADPWTATVRVLRTEDGACIGEQSQSFPMADPEPAVRSLADSVLEWISRDAGATVQTPPAAYRVPEGASFPRYLLRLEQLLAVRCNSADENRPGALNGEREIIDGNLRQCLEMPDSVNARILLAQTVRAMKKIRPDVVAEFETRLARLQSEHPLPQPAQEVVQELLDQA